jgi:hypothetical protein
MNSRLLSGHPQREDSDNCQSADNTGQYRSVRKRLQTKKPELLPVSFSCLLRIFNIHRSNHFQEVTKIILLAADSHTVVNNYLS